MRRPTRRRRGVVLLSTLLAVAAAVVVPAGPAGATPAGPTAGASAATPATRAVPTPGPSRRVCPPATAGTVTCYAEERTDVTPATANAAPAGYGPADLRSAYSIPASGGSGVTVATVVAYDYPTAAADLATYRSRYGLPALGANQFTKVNQNGASGPLPAYNAGWAGEAALDVQMITATCPACRILLVEASSSNLNDIVTAARSAARLGATFVSNSYGAEDGGTTSLASGYAAAGVSYFASTGDEGDDPNVVGNAPSFPATAPGVIAVGGTSLSPDGDVRGWRETVWSGTGHGTGCSATYGKPAFQNGVTTGCTGRAVADVAAVGDPATGVAVYNSGGGGWRVFGGTSASAPIVAGIAAVADEPGVTGDDVYLNAGSFHDVTSGRTPYCTGGDILCAAGAGWDGPTGLGTPDGVSGFTTPSAGCGGTPATPASNSVTSAGRYVPVTPQRVLDTRLDGTTLGSGGVRTLDLGRYLPGAASAVVVNVTVTGPTAAGYVTAWPAGTTRPVASTLNTVPGLTRANEATVALGPTPDSGGSPRGLSLYNSVGSADLIVDLLGWYTTAGDTTAGLTYHPAATPSRVVDTRTSSGPLSASGTRSVVCPTLTQYFSNATPISHIAAVAVTLTAVDPAAAGYLKAWDGDVTNEPTVSSVNFVANQVVPNATVVPVSCLDSACSRVTFAVANRISPSTQVIVDVVGVYAADPYPGLVFKAQTPQRIVDTRTHQGFGTLGSNTTATVVVPGAAQYGAVAANVTAVTPAASTYLTVFGGGTRPSTSNLNPVPGEIVPAEVVTGVDSNSAVSVYNLVGRVDVVVDVAGVFATLGS